MINYSKNEMAWACEVSSLYHEYRQCFLNRLYKMILFAIIIFNAILIANIGKFSGFWGVTLMLTPIVLASLDLVFGYSETSLTHKHLRFRYTQLWAKLIEKKINEETLDEITKEFILLTAEEPPSYAVLLDHCTNLVNIRQGEKEQLIPIGRIKKLLMNIYRFNETEPETNEKGTTKMTNETKQPQKDPGWPAKKHGQKSGGNRRQNPPKPKPKKPN